MEKCLSYESQVMKLSMKEAVLRDFRPKICWRRRGHCGQRVFLLRSTDLFLPIHIVPDVVADPVINYIELEPDPNLGPDGQVVHAKLMLSLATEAKTARCHLQ